MEVLGSYFREGIISDGMRLFKDYEGPQRMNASDLIQTATLQFLLKIFSCFTVQKFVEPGQRQLFNQ